jgi:hypothetical protein
MRRAMGLFRRSYFLDSVIVIIIGAKKNRIPIAIFKT